jgi:hypothetical protein
MRDKRMSNLLNDFVGAGEQRQRYLDAERLRGLRKLIQINIASR